MFYYFHIRDGKHLVRDEEGTDCRDLVAVRAEALSSAYDLASEAFKSRSMRAVATIEIEDEDGNAVKNHTPRKLVH
jgi:hypothetical protein